MTGYSFGITLRGYRERAGLSMAALGDRAGIEHSTISRWEGGSRQPTRANVVAVAEALGLSDADTDVLLISAEYLPRDPASLLGGETALLIAYRMLTDGNSAQRAYVRREMTRVLDIADGMLGFRLVGGGR